MRKKYIMLCIILLVLLIFICLGYMPVKKAVNLNDLDISEYYVIAKVQKSTISPWIAVGDSDGYYEDSRDIYLTGNKPQGYDYAIEVGENTFICYGKYTGTSDIGAGEYYTFDVASWEILYPIKREGGVFDSILPKGYLCKYDMK